MRGTIFGLVCLGFSCLQAALDRWLKAPILLDIYPHDPPAKGDYQAG